MSLKLYLTKSYGAVTVLIIGYVLVALYFILFLQFNFLQSDVLTYWISSLGQTPFDVFIVQGYPLTIAFLRIITFGILPPVVLMMTINIVAFSVSIYFVYQIIKSYGASKEFATVGAFLFGLWPFVGLTYTVHPISDMPAMSLFLVGLYFIQYSRKLLITALFFGLSIFTHKAMFFFVVLIIIANLLYRKEYISKQNILFIGITFLPLSIYWVVGSYYHHSLTWILSNNFEVHVVSNSNIPIFDGLIGTIVNGDVRGIVKGTLILALFAISAISLYSSAILKYKYFQYGIAISVATLILFLALNQYEIWAAVRFSRLLVIPLASSASARFKGKVLWPPVIVTFVLLFLSQFPFAWYISYYQSQ